MLHCLEPIKHLVQVTQSRPHQVSINPAIPDKSAVIGTTPDVEVMGQSVAPTG